MESVESASIPQNLMPSIRFGWGWTRSSIRPRARIDSAMARPRTPRWPARIRLEPLGATAPPPLPPPSPRCGVVHPSGGLPRRHPRATPLSTVVSRVHGSHLLQRRPGARQYMYLAGGRAAGRLKTPRPSARRAFASPPEEAAHTERANASQTLSARARPPPRTAAANRKPGPRSAFPGVVFPRVIAGRAPVRPASSQAGRRCLDPKLLGVRLGLLRRASGLS